jgi:hypothetical protein
VNTYYSLELNVSERTQYLREIKDRCMISWEGKEHLSRLTKETVDELKWKQ